MATVGGYPLSSFVAPANGKLIIEAADVRTNDNTIATQHTAHDADPKLHWQSSTLALRPNAPFTAQRTWITTDGRRIYLDNGSAWEEIAYLPLADGGTVAGAVILGSTLSFSTAATRIIPGATSFAIRNNANNADNLIITNAGGITGRTSIIATTFLQAAGAGAAATANLRMIEDDTGFYQDTADEAIACANAQISFKWDDSAVAGETRFLIYAVTGGLTRVKTAGNGTGPGGVGRALYVDDA